MTGLWAGAAVALLPILALLFSQRLGAAWLPPVCLVSLVCLAAGGLIAEAPAYLMIVGVTASLAAWDLTSLEPMVKDSSSPSTARRFERRHVLSLALALGLGLLLAESGRLLSFEIPFALLILLILLDLFSLDRLTHSL